MGLESSIYPLTLDYSLDQDGVAVDADVLGTDIEITKELLDDGISGLLRVYFCMTTAGADYELELIRKRVDNRIGSGATATATISNGVIDGVVVTSTGNNYQSGVEIAQPRTEVKASPSNGSILEPVLKRGQIVSITVTAGGSGFTSVPTIDISSFFTSTALALKFNGDNNFLLKSGGYYRFDIGAVPGDILNFKVQGQAVTKILEFRIDQIQFGA